MDDTAPRPAPPGRTVTRIAWAVGVGAWLLAAALLLRTVVPWGLSLPSIDVDATFGRSVVADARAYERGARWIWLASQLALLVTLAAYARRGAVFTRESAAGPIGTGMLLGMLGLAITWAVQLPFGLASLWWDRRHDVSRVGYLEWAFGGWAELTAAFVSICAALLVVMALARRLGEWWWLPGAAVGVAVVTLFAFGAPYLSSLDRPRDSSLERRYAELARQEGLDDVPLRVERVSGDTSQANAYAFGLGPSRRIVLWDTLLDGRFADDEVDVVMAHEIGHHVSRHIPKAIAWFGLFALPCCWLLMRFTRRRGGMGEPEAVPLALLVVTVLTLVLSPLQNWIGRRMEAEADWRALTATRDPEAAKRLFVDFTRTSLGDPSPPTWAYLLLSTHPTLAQRVALAEAWAARDAGR